MYEVKVNEMKVYTLGCTECEYVFERECIENCPRCECEDVDVIELEEEK